MRLKNKFKFKFLLLFFPIFLFNICLLSASNIKYISSNLKIKSINPTIPKSGDLLTITFELTNIGNKRGCFFVKFFNNSVFQFISKDEEKIDVGAKETRDFNVYFKVKEDVKSAKYPLIAEVVSETGEEKTFTFFIEVKNRANLVLEQKNFVCLIGKKCNLNLTLLNNGYGKAKNIILSFNLPSKTIEVEKLNPLSYKKINSDIYIPENLDEGVYNLKVSISYMDENNNLIKKDLFLPIELKSNVDLQISSLDYDKEEKYIKIKIENSGEGKAKEIKVEVELPKLNLKRAFYIGSLSEDEDSTVYFYLPKLYVKENEQPIVIKVYWKDYKNKEKEFKGLIFIENGLEKNDKIKEFLIILMFLVLVYLIFKKVAKKEQIRLKDKNDKEK